ncbi:lysylphosphatidylglycerol synthase domain-containing protein [Geodermatophilus sp. SYSU D00815]
MSTTRAPVRALRARFGSAALTALVAVAVFAGVLPQIGDYSAAWELLGRLSTPAVALLAAVALVNLLSYAPLWMAALPGLRWTRAVLADQVSTAMANTLPAGWAVGVGVNAVMFHAFGFGPAAITRAVVLTGVWNNLVKLAMPGLALAALAATGEAAEGLVVAAVAGVGVLLLATAALVAVLADPHAAAVVSGTAERAAGAVCALVRRPRPAGWVAATDRFRTDSLALVRERWPQLSLAAVASHAAVFVLFLTTLRLVDGADGISWLVALAVFSVTRLVTLVPVTPGALGVAELSYVAGLTAVGVDGSAATAVVLLFRFLTWFLPIPGGALAWAVYRRGAGADHPAHAREPAA